MKTATIPRHNVQVRIAPDGESLKTNYFHSALDQQDLNYLTAYGTSIDNRTHLTFVMLCCVGFDDSVLHNLQQAVVRMKNNTATVQLGSTVVEFDEGQANIKRFAHHSGRDSNRLQCWAEAETGEAMLIADVAAVFE